jgi:class 3 adenylate cyclase
LPEGERRHAMVVFSDLSGYTALNERVDPEEVESLIGRLKADAARIVEAHGALA